MIELQMTKLLWDSESKRASEGAWDGEKDSKEPLDAGDAAETEA